MRRKNLGVQDILVIGKKNRANCAGDFVLMRTKRRFYLTFRS